jgi:F-type H+-transporting ATPase subunit gamma
VPANSKTIRKRIKSVASTKKITKTMEMVATSKLKRTQGRVMQSRPYTEALRNLMGTLGSSIESLGISPLFERRDPMERVLVLLITANRGLCGGFNTNLVRLCRDHLRALEGEELQPLLHVCGKKGASALRFRGESIESLRTDLSDNPSFEDADEIAAPLLEAFLGGEVDRVDVIFADFQSTARQPPTVLTLLPVGSEPEEHKPEEGEFETDFLFEPSPAELLEELGPLYVKQVMYRVLLSSVASEQFARRTAMKNATDNAADMEKSLTQAYNKARQAAITQEIAEIVGGAAALE